MACNNACYYIQCMEGKMLTEQKTDDNSITVAKSDWSWKYAGKGADNRYVYPERLLTDLD